VKDIIAQCFCFTSFVFEDVCIVNGKIINMRHHEIYTVHKINMKSSLFLLKAMTIIIRLTHNVLTLGCSPFI